MRGRGPVRTHNEGESPTARVKRGRQQKVGEPGSLSWPGGIWSRDPTGWVFTAEGWCAYNLGSTQCAVRHSRIMEKYVQVGSPKGNVSDTLGGRGSIEIL